MMKHKGDNLTIDMFAELPPAPVTEDGGLACRVEIAHLMSAAMRGQDRYEIACKMSKLLGRNVSKARLDQMSAESAEAHTPPFDWAVAFDAATGSNVLIEFHARKLGAKVVYGKEALDVKLAKKMRQLDELSKEIKTLKRVIGKKYD